MTNDNLNARSSSLRRGHSVRGLDETQGTSRSSLITLGGGLKVQS